MLGSLVLLHRAQALHQQSKSAEWAAAWCPPRRQTQRKQQPGSRHVLCNLSLPGRDIGIWSPCFAALRLVWRRQSFRFMHVLVGRLRSALSSIPLQVAADGTGSWQSEEQACKICPWSDRRGPVDVCNCRRQPPQCGSSLRPRHRQQLSFANLSRCGARLHGILECCGQHLTDIPLWSTRVGDQAALSMTQLKACNLSSLSRALRWTVRM